MTDEVHDKQFLPNSGWCFVCGEENPAGLKTRFYVEEGRVKTRVRPEAHHCGYQNVVHGGVVAAMIDECMGWAASHAIRRMCVTGELTVRYIQNAPADRDLIVSTEVVKANKRLAYTKGELVDEAGTCYATAEGKFLPMSVEETLKVDDMLNYRDGEIRLFDELR